MRDTIFESLFQQTDIEVTLDISSHEALGGGHRRITVPSNMVCPGCQCQGVVEGFFTSKRCDMCQGNGIVPSKQQILVTIPASIPNGTRLRIPGEGLLGFPGTRRGDLYVTVRIIQDQIPAQWGPAVPAVGKAIQILQTQQSADPHKTPAMADLSLPMNQIGNYRILQLIGTGGGGKVYLGQHCRLETFAAIKVLQQLTPEDEQRFLMEAQTLARLKHPHILRVFDFGTEHTIPFLVMDYAQNGSLHRHHKKGEILPPRLVSSYLSQIASALQYAHDQRVIHRDVKPDNILVDQFGMLLLSDFGIAVIAHSTHSQKLEEPFGTALYVAPEQLQGHPRPASDQYALAVVVYEWLCGRAPFHGTRTEVLSQHCITPPPPLRQWNAKLSTKIENVVLKALAKEYTQRFDSVYAFAQAFKNAL